jgi:CheY-like chemotaxis protein
MLRSVLGATLSLKLELDRNAAAILADPGQVEQALVNLALNARDAMEAGGTLTIRVDEIHRESRARSGGERFVRLSVSDTGHGIPEALRSRIFDPFFTTKPVGKGTGLGLSTVYGIMQDAGGTIDLQSEVGRGTTFHLCFRPADDVEVAAPEAGHTEAAKGQSRRVLLVEDVDLVRELIEHQLQILGYEVLTAEDGLAALAVLEAHPVDAVVSDVVMPRMGGIELASELSKRAPSIPCLLVTGYSSDELVHTDSRVPMPVLRKPFTTRELAIALERLLPWARHG